MDPMGYGHAPRMADLCSLRQLTLVAGALLAGTGEARALCSAPACVSGQIAGADPLAVARLPANAPGFLVVPSQTLGGAPSFDASNYFLVLEGGAAPIVVAGDAHPGGKAFYLRFEAQLTEGQTYEVMETSACGGAGGDIASIGTIVAEAAAPERPSGTAEATAGPLTATTVELPLGPDCSQEERRAARELSLSLPEAWAAWGSALIVDWYVDRELWAPARAKDELVIPSGALRTTVFADCDESGMGLAAGAHFAQATITRPGGGQISTGYLDFELDCSVLGGGEDAGVMDASGPADGGAQPDGGRPASDAGAGGGSGPVEDASESSCRCVGSQRSPGLVGLLFGLLLVLRPGRSRSRDSARS